MSEDSSKVPSSKDSSSNGLIDSSIGDSSVESSSSSVDDKHSSFEDFAKVLETAANKEAFTCHQETMKETSVAGSIKDVVTKDLTITADKYSLATGTFEEYLGDTLSIQDNITEIRSINEFKYKIDERDYKTDMFYSVTDFEKDLSPKYDYSDSAFRQYVVHSALDIGDLSEGSYMFDDEAEYALSFKNTTYLLNFVDSYFYSNPYAEQVGCIAMDKESLDKETIKYSVSCKYELEGDLNDIQKIEISMSATFDEKGQRLTSFATSYVEDDINKTHTEDHRITSLQKEGTLKYDDRRNKAKDAPSAEDYFLASVDSVELLGTDRSVIDPTKVSPANSYIFLQPKEYSPAKAIGVNEFTISPEASSDEKVVIVEKTNSGNHFIVKGEGKATLTYSYVGVDEDGYYHTIYKTYDVVVMEYAEPAKISVQYIHNLDTDDIISTYGEKNIDATVGMNYKFLVNIVDEKGATKNVPQGFEITSSDETIIKPEVNNGYVLFTPLKAGEVALKIVSTEKPDIAWQITFTVYDNSEVDIDKILVSYKWTRSWSFIGYINDWDTDNMYIDATMTFKEDGTGVATYNNKTTDKNYTDPFTWNTKDGKIYIKGLDKCGYYGNGNITFALLSDDNMGIRFYTDEDNAGKYEYRGVAL